MNNLVYKTRSLSNEEARINRKWILVDAQDQVLGRLASKVAIILRGKHKPGFTPHIDCGDSVIIINAEKVKLTGNKLDDKEYVTYTGYPGGQRVKSPKDMLAKFPERIIEHAVKGMLPKNKLGRELFRNLKVYAGPNHEHEAQQPQMINLNEIK
jgi:large subunit ribosomal protein L13